MIGGAHLGIAGGQLVLMGGRPRCGMLIGGPGGGRMVIGGHPGMMMHGGGGLMLGGGGPRLVIRAGGADNGQLVPLGINAGFGGGGGKSRASRLASGTSLTLYHQTCKAAYAKIKKSGMHLMRGSTGLAGGGIYFATSMAATRGKAHHKGVMLTCMVKLGNVKTISPNGDGSITFAKLQKQGYDSVKIPRGGGTEFVTYNYDQVTILNAKFTGAKCPSGCK